MGLFTAAIKWLKSRRDPQLKGGSKTERKQLADDIWKNSLSGPQREWAWGPKKRS
jgi:hypothetical protein